MALKDIINVAITLNTRGITRQGFATAMILAYHTKFPELSREYGDLEEMAEDFETFDPAYKLAQALLGGSVIKPKTIKVGRRTRPATQIVQFLPTNTTQGFVVGLTATDPNGTTHPITHTNGASETVAAIVAALVTQLDALADLTAASGGGNTYAAATAVAGDYWYFTELTGLNFKDATVNPGSGGIASDLADVIGYDSDFYWVLTPDGNSEAQGNALAAAVEAMERQAALISSDSEIAVGATLTDLGSDLLAAQYMRTNTHYSADHDGYLGARVVGEVIAQSPGSASFAYVTASGVTADRLSAGQETALLAKNVNRYTIVAGKGVTFPGKVAGGEFIDVIYGRDWLVQRIRENGFIAVSTRPKLSYDQDGADAIGIQVEAALKEGVRTKFLAADPAPVVTVPDVLVDVEAADRAARHLPGVEFTARIAGAILTVDISGSVSA